MSLKINYSGSSCQTDFEYRCSECDEHIVLTHKRSDDMRGRSCPECDGKLYRHISKPPALGADYHEGCLARNIGWDA